MTFLEKYKLLKKSVPVSAVTIGPYTVDCEYVDYLFKSKNCYYSIEGFFLENCIYIDFATLSNKLADCTHLVESEKCYECVDCGKCHSCTYLFDCYNCTDCHFSALLNSCSDCFGCVGLIHKKYCIFNQQYSKDEYFKKVEELKKENPESIFRQMIELKKRMPHPASQQFDSDNCPYGNYIYNSKNCYWSFNTLYSQNSGYTYYCTLAKNCWDMFRSGGSKAENAVSERCYEMVYSRPSNYGCAFLTTSQNCTNSYYSTDLRNSSDCFGCVGLTNKKYCILNNQLTKGEYEKAVKEIRKDLGWNF